MVVFFVMGDLIEFFFYRVRAFFVAFNRAVASPFDGVAFYFKCAWLLKGFVPFVNIGHIKIRSSVCNLKKPFMKILVGSFLT